MQQVAQQPPSAEQIILAHQRPLWRFLVALGCPPADADDLTQEALITVLRQGFTYRGQLETAAWLRRVAKNLFISQIRRRRLAPLVANLDDVDAQWGDFEAECAGDDRVALLRQCLEHLDERERSALELRYRTEASRPAMAKALGLEESGVKTLLERLRKRLKECVLRKLGHERE